MLKKLLLLLLVIAMPVLAADTPLYITASDWAQPRSGESLLRHPVLSEAVHQLEAKDNTVLEIRYPGGDSGSLWASELRAWLVALGVESSRIRLLPGSDKPDQLQLSIR